MLSDTEQQEVVNYVMADVPRRLELAVGMYAAYDKVRAEVMRKFIRELTDRLLVSLPPGSGWTIDPQSLLGDQLFAKNGSLDIRNSAWEGDIRVRLGASSYGPNDWWMGIWMPKVNSRFEVIRQGLVASLGQGHEPEQECPWWRPFDPKWKNWKLNNWQVPSAVLALGEGGSGPYGDYLHDSLVEISQRLDEVLKSSATGARGGAYRTDQ